MKHISQQQKKHPRYLSFMSMLVAVLWITCLVSQDRLVALPTGYICAAVIPYPFLCITFDIIAELYGFHEARKVLWLAFISISIFVLCVYFFAKLPSPAILHRQTVFFNGEMAPLLRILFFNSLAFIVGQYINVYMFSKMSLMLKGQFFAVRSIVSTFIGDSITFAVSIFGDFSGLIHNHSMFLLVIDELLMMYLMAMILSIPASFFVRLLKRIEPEYNLSVSFNPFKSSPLVSVDNMLGTKDGSDKPLA